MTKESLAELLNGREYGEEISDEEAKTAKEAGLIVAFGYSDDLFEFRGAINNEVDGGGEIRISRSGVVEMEYSEEQTLKKFGFFHELLSKTALIIPQWDEVPGYSWACKTEIPHATFDVMEGNEKFCRGIVFCIDDLPL